MKSKLLFLTTVCLMVCVMLYALPTSAAADIDPGLYPTYITDEQNVKTYGYINNSGVFVIEPVYSDAGDFNNYGFAIVKGHNAQHGIIDKKGQLIVPFEPGYHLTPEIRFYENRITAMRYEQEGEGLPSKRYVDLYDFEGNLLYSFLNGFEYSEGLIAFRQYLEDHQYRYGYMNEAGEIVIPAIFKEAGEFINERTVVQLENGNIAIIDSEGNIIKEFPPGYTARIFGGWHGGLVPVTSDSTDSYSATGYYSMEDGSLVLDHQFYYSDVFRDGYAVTSQQTGNGVIDKNGNFVIAPHYNFMFYMGGGRYFANTYAETRHLLDLQGNQLLTLPGKQPHFPEFKFGLSSYYDSITKQAVVFNTDGQVIASVDADNAAVICSSDLVRVARGGDIVYIRLSNGSVVRGSERGYEVGGGIQIEIRKYEDIDSPYIPFESRHVTIDYPALSSYQDQALEKYINKSIYDFFLLQNRKSNYDEYLYQKGESIFHIEGGVGSFTKQSAYGTVGSYTNPYRITLNIDLATGRTYSFFDLFLPGSEAELEQRIQRALGERIGAYTLPITGDTAFELIDGGIRFYQVHDGMRESDPGYVYLLIFPFSEIDDLINKNGDMWRAMTKGSPQTANRPALPFPDVLAPHWAYAYTKMVFEQGLMYGTGQNFLPDGVITYEQAASVFARLLLENTGAERPAPGANEPWYTVELEAARGLGLLVGLDDDFAVGKAILREDVMVMLANTLKAHGFDTDLLPTETDEILSRFNDTDELSQAKREAAAICVKTGFITGSGDNLLPKGNYTRAQAAKILSLILEINS